VVGSTAVRTETVRGLELRIGLDFEANS